LSLSTSFVIFFYWSSKFTIFYLSYSISVSNLLISLSVYFLSALSIRASLSASKSGAGDVDLGPFQIAITKMQTQIKQKAEQSDFEALREALMLKADKK
jgi:hypothetical protein